MHARIGTFEAPPRTIGEPELMELAFDSRSGG
jgi:hypothetical protein